MFGRNKRINLSASVINAFEIVRQALEIRYGQEVRFVGPMGINPDTIEQEKMGGRRQVSFETKFIERIPQEASQGKEVLAIVLLEKNSENVWVLDGADIQVVDPNDPSDRRDKSWWYRVRYAMEHPFDTRLYICDVMRGPNSKYGHFVNPVVWRGHGIADRHESPMYPREAEV